MLELFIGLLITILISRYIFKGYPATGILLMGGLILLLISAFLGKQVLPDDVPSTGSRFADIFESVKYLLMKRGGNVGMMIMILCGFEK